MPTQITYANCKLRCVKHLGMKFLNWLLQYYLKPQDIRLDPPSFSHCQKSSSSAGVFGVKFKSYCMITNPYDRQAPRLGVFSAITRSTDSPREVEMGLGGTVLHWKSMIGSEDVEEWVCPG
jgi:hypothetical protein